MIEQAEVDNPTSLRFRPFEWLLLGVAIVATALCAYRPIQYAAQYSRFPLDAYYYFEMAHNLRISGTMLVRFEQGLPNKFFPGYPLVLAAASIGSAPHLAWPWLQSVLACAVAALLYAACRGWQCSRAASLASVALLLSNPVFIKWLAAPAAEAAAVAWVLAASLAASRVKADQGWHWAALTGLLVSAATITRPDAAYFIPAIGILLLCRTPRISPLQIGVYLLVASGPLCAFVVSRQFAAGGVTYVSVFRKMTDAIHPWNQFLSHAVRFIRDPRGLHPIWWLNVPLVVLQAIMYLLILGSMAFGFGRKLALLAWIAVGYLVMHSFWYYTSERFNLLILPVLALLVALALEKILVPWPRLPMLEKWGAWLFAVVIMMFVVLCEPYSAFLIRFHQYQLAPDGAQPHRLAAFANDPPGLVWSEAGADFAYFCKGPVYIDYDEPHFYKRTETAGDFFAAKKVKWVVSTQPDAHGWFEKHPDVSSATLSLVPRATDRVYTLYTVQRR